MLTSGSRGLNRGRTGAAWHRVPWDGQLSSRATEPTHLPAGPKYLWGTPCSAASTAKPWRSPGRCCRIAEYNMAEMPARPSPQWAGPLPRMLSLQSLRVPLWSSNFQVSPEPHSWPASALGQRPSGIPPELNKSGVSHVP